MKNDSRAKNAAEMNVAQSLLPARAGKNLSPRQWKIVRAFSVSFLLLAIA